MIKEYFQKVFYLLDDDKKKIPILTLLFIFLSLFDIFGISIVASYISFISNDIAVDNLMIQIFEVIGWSIEKDRLLVNMGLLIIAIFLLKTIFSDYGSRSLKPKYLLKMDSWISFIIAAFIPDSHSVFFLASILMFFGVYFLTYFSTTLTMKKKYSPKLP